MEQSMQHKHTSLGLILIGLAVMLFACTFSTNETIEPAANDLRLTPAATAWVPTATTTGSPTSESAGQNDTDGAADDAGIIQTTGSQVSSSASGNTTSTGSASYNPAPSVNTGSSSAQTHPGYVVNTSPPAPACGLVPTGAYNVNIRQSPDLNAAIVGTLTQGSWVYAARVAGGWYQVQYPGTPVHGAWISGKVVTLTQPCTCGPTCGVVSPPPPPPPSSACTVTNRMAQGVMSEPYGNGYPVTQLGPNTTSPALSKTGDGTHYRIQTPFGAGWISVVQNVILAGDCHLIPVEVYNPPAECRVQNHMAQGVMSEPYGEGYPVTQLGPNTTSTATARTNDGAFYQINTAMGPGWISVVENASIMGVCETLPIVDPPPGECRLQIHQVVDVLPRPGWGPPITQLGANTFASALARTPDGNFYKVGTPAGNGWVFVLHDVSLTGDCDAVAIEEPAPPGDRDMLTYSADGFAFDYPANWHVRETEGRVIVTSYDHANGDPPHAAFVDPSLVKITFQAEAFDGGQEEWVARYMAHVDDITLSVFAEQPIALPGGIQALRLEMVGGTGGFPVLLTVIEDNGIYVEGMMANYANFDRVVGTLRATP